MVRLVNSNRFLIDAAYAPSTLKKYKSAVVDFLNWCIKNFENPRDFEELDDVLVEYLHQLYLAQRGKGKAHDTYFGLLMYLRHARGQLPNSELALRGWNKKHPARSYPPLTWELSVAIAVQMVRRGDWRHAVGTLLSFDCFLRVGELVGLKREDVADTEDIRIGAEFKGMALRLRKTKTGPNQWVEVEDNAVKELLRGIIKTTKSKGYLFPFSTSSFRRSLKLSCQELGLSPEYVPHSLRHGGATRSHLLGRSLEDILMRGRWASTKSARRYIQAGRGMLLSISVPKKIAKISQVLASDVILSLSLAQSH